MCTCWVKLCQSINSSISSVRISLMYSAVRPAFTMALYWLVQSIISNINGLNMYTCTHWAKQCLTFACLLTRMCCSYNYTFATHLGSAGHGHSAAAALHSGSAQAEQPVHSVRGARHLVQNLQTLRWSCVRGISFICISRVCRKADNSAHFSAVAGNIRLNISLMYCYLSWPAIIYTACIILLIFYTLDVEMPSVDSDIDNRIFRKSNIR